MHQPFIFKVCPAPYLNSTKFPIYLYGLIDMLRAIRCTGYRSWDIFTHKNRSTHVECSVKMCAGVSLNPRKEVKLITTILSSFTIIAFLKYAAHLMLTNGTNSGYTIDGIICPLVPSCKLQIFFPLRKG